MKYKKVEFLRQRVLSEKFDLISGAEAREEIKFLKNLVARHKVGGCPLDLEIVALIEMLIEERVPSPLAERICDEHIRMRRLEKSQSPG